MACNCSPQRSKPAPPSSPLPGEQGFVTVYVSKAPLHLEYDGRFYNFVRMGKYYVDARDAPKLLELDEVDDGRSIPMESDQAAEAEN